MSLDTLRPSPSFKEFLPIEYKDLIEHGPYGNRNGSDSQTVRVKDMGKFKEVIEEHPMCAGCAYATMLTVSKPNRVEEVIQNAVYIAREVGPTFVQLYTPCILEIGKQSMEGLDEMKDSEQIGGRFVNRSYITDEAQAVVDRLKQEKKERKRAAKKLKPKKEMVVA